MPRRPSTKTCIRGLRRGGWACLVVLLSAGCSKPQPFNQGDSIPIGPVQLIVSGVEVSAADDRPRFIWQGLQHGPKAGPPESMIQVVVSIRCNGSNRFVRMDLHDRMLEREGITLQDSAGGSYSTLDWPSGKYRGSYSGSLRDFYEYENWVAGFYVPQDRNGFTLVIKNVDRLPGQPSAAVVPLGR
jgi:hypothetical protein